MKKFFFALTVLFFFSTYVFGEYRMQPVQCTLKKHSNCGAYLYNSSTGATYFCDSEKCKEVETPIEIFIEEEEVIDDSKGSLIPKKPKKKESKIPKKPKKKESKIPKKPKKKESKVPRKPEKTN